METYAQFPRDLADLFDRLDRSGLVVSVHDSDQNRTRIDCAPDEIRIQPTPPVDGQVGDLGAEALKEGEGLQDCWVLCGLCDDMIALFPKREEGALDGQIIRFASAACEDDLRGARPEKSGDLCS